MTTALKTVDRAMKTEFYSGNPPRKGRRSKHKPIKQPPATHQLWECDNGTT